MFEFFQVHYSIAKMFALLRLKYFMSLQILTFYVFLAQSQENFQR